MLSWIRNATTRTCLDRIKLRAVSRNYLRFGLNPLIKTGGDIANLKLT